MFSVPLRRALIIEQPLTYPEGVATAQVLKGFQFIEKNLGPIFFFSNSSCKK